MRNAMYPLLLAAIMATSGASAEGPRRSPAFTIQRVGAKDLQLNSYRGKVVVLVFISTTCPHCQELTQKLIPMAKEYAPRGVQFLECAVNETAKTDLAGFIQQFNPPFPVGYNTQAAVDVYVQRSVVDARPFYVPHLVFLDRDGFIQGDYAGESDFVKDPANNTRIELEKLLAARPKEAAGAPKKTAAK
jgi:thiol-disulfide isomerase/thioredoxin